MQKPKIDWTFIAQAIPERVPLTFNVPGLKITSQKSGTELLVHSVSVDRSQITCPVSILSGTPGILFIRNMIDQHLRSIIDFFGYQQGLSFELDIISAIDEKGQQISFGIGIPGLMAAHKAQPGKHEIPADALLAAITNEGTCTALAQFRKAMREATGTGFYCYQSIEALMHAHKASNSNEASAWNNFRKALNVERSAIDYVKLHADDRRHGRIADISDAERLKVFLITDKIIERFMELLRSKQSSLDIRDYPTITLSTF